MHLPALPMSPMWDDEPSTGSGICASCGHFAKNGRVHWVPRVSGPDIRTVTHTDPGECPPAPDPTDSRPTADSLQAGRARPRSGGRPTAGGHT